MGWEKTDDLQYVRKIEQGVYHIAEARYAEDKYLICNGTVTIGDYLDDTGNYDKECKSLICSFYSSVEAFCDNYKDIEVREWILAEMIFEERPYYETDWSIAAEGEEEAELLKIVSQ